MAKSPKSGSKNKPKPQRSIGVSQEKDKADSLHRLAPPGLETDLALMSPAEARVHRALHKYKIPWKKFEESGEISSVIWRTIGSIKGAIEALKFSADEDQIPKLLKFWAKMSYDERMHLPLEIACLACDIEPAFVLGEIVLCATEVAKMESALVLITRNAEVLRSTANFGANYVDNFKDREAFLKATGTIKTPAGGGVNLNLSIGQSVSTSDEPHESTLPQDVFAYDNKVIEGWGEDRRNVLEGGDK